MGDAAFHQLGNISGFVVRDNLWQDERSSYSEKIRA